MIKHILTLGLFGFATLCTSRNTTGDCNGVNGINPRCPSNEIPHTRDFFYVGGRYIQAALGSVTVDQIYVEKLSPVSGAKQKHPLVFFHGGGTSAVSWLNTPDNR